MSTLKVQSYAVFSDDNQMYGYFGSIDVNLYKNEGDPGKFYAVTANEDGEQVSEHFPTIESAQAWIDNQQVQA